jgi:hypothetical protein
MHKLLIAVVAAVVLIGAVAMPTEAATSKYRSNGWHVFYSNQKAASTTLIDRTPAKAYVYVALQKKAGARKCRARVTFIRNGIAVSRVFEKYSRTRTRAGQWYIGGAAGRGKDRRIGVRITTNGRCKVVAAVA